MIRIQGVPLACNIRVVIARARLRFSWMSLSWYLLGTAKHAVLYSRAWHAGAWLFVAIFVAAIIRFFCRGYSWLSVAIRGYLCSVAIFLAVRGYLFNVSWLFVAILGYPWLFLAISQKNSRVAIFSRGYFLKVPQIPMPQTCEIAAKIAVCKNSRALKSVVKRGSKNSLKRVAILVC